ncbi:hypothetical protein HR060_16305 [Catenovulum sp. SM1970]|uniref:LPS-assembly lipoprotein LptE n=1 Tax=Marinifaba aquimaris TaxID=2741323 RepID=UPI0015731BB2|nr:LPS assembly lipoprotein LptE [Marinifaba aquimaris]NTS78412.1 hypothetical protein [Marinifaba aquimaris]
MFKTSIKPLLKQASILLLACLIVSCGFQMRGSYHVPAHLKNLCLQADSEKPLVKALRERLKLSGVQLADNDIAAQVSDSECAQLVLLSDTLERRTLSLFPNAQVAEYQLIYQVKYLVEFDSARGTERQIEDFEFEIYRDYQDDPDRVLAKSREMKLILSEMRQQAADRIVRSLSAIQY